MGKKHAKEPENAKTNPQGPPLNPPETHKPSQTTKTLNPQYPEKVLKPLQGPKTPKPPEASPLLPCLELHGHLQELLHVGGQPLGIPLPWPVGANSMCLKEEFYVGLKIEEPRSHAFQNTHRLLGDPPDPSTHSRSKAVGGFRD